MALNAFEEYLLHEFNLPTSVCCNNFKYSHSSKQKIDKKSNIPIINNTINVKIESYDDKHNLLASHSEKFIDGFIHRTKQNPLVNIAPAELNNRFAAAKSIIASKIMNEYTIKLNEINEKIESLQSYIHVSNDNIIPNEFINEPAIGNDTSSSILSKNKNFEF